MATLVRGSYEVLRRAREIAAHRRPWQDAYAQSILDQWRSDASKDSAQTPQRGGKQAK